MSIVPRLQTEFRAYLASQHLEKSPTELYEPIRYIMGLGGKQIRPLLVLLGAYLFDDEQYERALPTALAVEVFHNFSLVHDDIMDESPLRRGQPTVHAKYGTNTGILAGDLMLIYAYDYLLQTKPGDRIAELLSVFSKVAIKVCEGQQYDVNFERQDDITIADYLHMIELKTAALLSGALELGAIVGGADADSRHHLAEFGRLMGIAFQVQDDILDVFGDPRQVGKRAGNDIVKNKKTFLYLRALELSDADTRRRLQTYYQSQPADPEEKVATVTRLLHDLNIPRETADLRDRMQAEAYAHLERVAAPAERKQLLRELAEELLQRQS